MAMHDIFAYKQTGVVLTGRRASPRAISTARAFGPSAWSGWNPPAFACPSRCLNAAFC